MFTLIRHCPICKKCLHYTNKSGYNAANKKNTPCISCAKIGHGYSHPNNRKRPHEWLYNSMLKKSKNRNIEVKLTYEEFLDFLKIKECHYCKAPITNPPEHITHRKGVSEAYFLDRKDNSVGYTKENLVRCCPVCNYLKSNELTYKIMCKIGKILEEEKINEIQQSKM